MFAYVCLSFSLASALACATVVGIEHDLTRLGSFFLGTALSFMVVFLSLVGVLVLA